MKKTISFLVLGIILITLLNFSNVQAIESKEINYFYMNGCSACGQMSPYLQSLEEKYNIQINSYEVSSKENSRLFQEKLSEYNVPADRRGYVPAVFIEDKYFIGYNEEIRTEIENILKGEGSEINDGIFGGDNVKTKVLGIWNVDVSFKDRSIIFSTIVLGFLDSLNVCSITVLIFLIVYTLSIGSLKRAFKLGLIFTAVIFLFYFSFMLLLTSLISSLITQYGYQIRLLVILISLFAGSLLIKDYFFYGKGFSLKVPESTKPMLEKYLKQATIISTIVFAILASLVELPCTAVFPLIYSTILAENSITGFARIFWIALYNLIYVLPLLLIVFGTYFSWTKIKDVDNKMQKIKGLMRLIAGIALLIIAIYFAYPLI